ncbi:hypothetical protein [Clostridium minihomine]|uniref:hypothetical protein n=1 Tax=Clostridium minihomine TaxID=2045012 RepID=UPI0013ECA8FD|nr:hypothetical protein [Clostridium minihomine]
MNTIRPVENRQFESEIYFKLQEAEHQAKSTKQRFSSKDVLKAIKDVLDADNV